MYHENRKQCSKLKWNYAKLCEHIELFFFVFSDSPYNIRNIKYFVIFHAIRSSDTGANEIVIVGDAVYHPFSSL